MTAESSESSDVDGGDALYRQVEDYPYGQDQDFQAGLSAILGSDASVVQSQELTLRARCFYYSRHACARPKHHVSVDFDQYAAWRARNALGQPATGMSTSKVPNSVAVSVSADDRPLEEDVGQRASTSQPNAPYPTSFAHIVDLITKGEPIPGVKEIPDTVLEGQESQSVTAVRKKPWEKEANESTTVQSDGAN